MLGDRGDLGVEHQMQYESSFTMALQAPGLLFDAQDASCYCLTSFSLRLAYALRLHLWQPLLILDSNAT